MTRRTQGILVLASSLLAVAAAFALWLPVGLLAAGVWLGWFARRVA